MQIQKIDVYKLNIALKYPLRVPIGIIDAARNVAVKITTNSGLTGWGEASPFAPITGDSQESNFVTARSLGELIKGKDALALEYRMKEINVFTVGEPSIRSAFDMALYDIAAKAAGMPLYRYLGGERRELRTNLTIGLQDSVEETLHYAEKILEAGFTSIKMKVGRPNGEDLAHVKAVRDFVGPEIALKIDSNQGWDFPSAVYNLKAMKAFDIQYSEQPLAVWDYEGLARLRDKVDLPICADESVFDDKDALKLIKMNAVDYLNIKLGKSGGVHTGLKINAIAEANGSKCMIGCFAESRLGLSAAAHLAMSRPNIAFLDLDSAYSFEADPVAGGVSYDKDRGGILHLPDQPGHGAAFDEKYLDESSRITIQ